MAFDLVAYGGYGTGSLGDVTNPTGQINTVADVLLSGEDDDYTDIGDTFYLTNKTVGLTGDFAAGMEVLIQMAGASDPKGANDDDIEYVGLWAVATIESVGSDGEITLTYDSKFEKTIKDIEATRGMTDSNDDTQIKIVSVAHFRNLTLNSGCIISPPQGFPLAIKCSGTLKLNGGHIDLRNRGFDMKPTHRPLLAQEVYGTLDTDKYSGWENSDALRHMPLNAGDGTAFIFAKTLNVANNTSRIGNPTFAGIQFNRSAADSPSRQTHTTNVGGSNIFIAAGTITNFSPNIIAKCRSLTSAEIANNDIVDTDNFAGLARCYIASNTILRNDEGLYAYDNISDSERVKNDLNILSFGDGSSGSFNSTARVNNYAAVSAIDATRQILTLAPADRSGLIGLTTDGFELLAIGKLVMVHFHHKTAANTLYSGRFILAHVLGISGDDVTLDTAIPEELYNVFDDYYCQIITVPQFVNYTLNGTHSDTPKLHGSDTSTNCAQGGIFAIAVKDTCDLSRGIINLEGKGGWLAYGDNGLAHIGNAQDCNKLPIGQGHGSVFILAKNLEMGYGTRIGATYSGAKFGGQGGIRDRDETVYSFGGGYSGANGYPCANSNVNPAGGSPYYSQDENITGSGDNARRHIYPGGRGANGSARDSDGNLVIITGARQGAHILIIADTITNFTQAAISTGGEHGAPNSYTLDAESSATVSSDGGAGYGGGGGRAGINLQPDYHGATGGGGGYQSGGSGGVNPNAVNYTISNPEGKYAYGGGGGGSGWAFVYCNNVVNQDTEYTIVRYDDVDPW